MRSWTHHVSLWLKRWPRVFDAACGLARRMGYRPPVYQFMARVADRLTDLTFVQAGANDGISTDPIREFVIARPKWKGVFIEPLPGLFARLKRSYRYAARPGWSSSRPPSLGEPGTGTIWSIKADCYRHYPVSARGTASFDKAMLTKPFPERAATIEAELEAVEVPCLTYGQIVERYSYPRVDLLVTDVEGHEPKIFSATRLAGPTAPQVVLNELDHIPPGDQAALLARFQSHGYHFRQLDKDGMAMCDEFRDLVNY